MSMFWRAGLVADEGGEEFVEFGNGLLELGGVVGGAGGEVEGGDGGGVLGGGGDFGGELLEGDFAGGAFGALRTFGAGVALGAWVAGGDVEGEVEGASYGGEGDVGGVAWGEGVGGADLGVG